MANIGYIESVLGRLPENVKAPVTEAFRYLLPNLSFGAVDSGERATNLNAVWLTGMTSTTANQEFSMTHGLEREPTFAMPVLPLNVVNAQTPVLKVTRAADSKRVYLSAASTNVAIAVLVG